VLENDESREYGDRGRERGSARSGGAALLVRGSS
jgi:hypothetical protein